MIVLSYFQARILLDARAAGAASLECSPDLNLTRQPVQLTADGARFPASDPIPWPLVEMVAENPNSCFRVENGQVHPVRVLSELYERVYSLYPTERAPTMLVSGIPMHRIKGTDPWRDSRAKIKALGKLRGCILDTATGLGYTAILAARSAEQVTSIELDPAAREIACANPWSQEMFERENLSLMLGDSFELIAGLEMGAFSAILHDPPTFGLAGDLYSLDFYRQAYRVLGKRGRMFHYIGNPESRSGAGVTRGVVQRLGQAGFRKVVHKPGAFGVTAYK
jgi:predicted methyltransferase